MKRQIVKKEPVLTAAGLGAVVSSIISVFSLLDIVTLDVDQLAAINTAVMTSAMFLFALWARSRVSPA